MPRPRHLFNRSNAYQITHHRAVRPMLEGLEERLLLYSTLGAQWTYDSRITYSFMPDGTSVGGVPSALYQTLNANYPTATWEQQLEDAASLWENVTNVNLSLVSDGGEPVGTSGNQQDDPRFGDIRIGAVPLSPGTLAVTFDPPPTNGGTDAGDILLNSNVNWQINSNYDLMTTVAHEFGHALGLGESSVSTAVMYGTYNGIKQELASDDIAGIESIYGTRQFDQFNTGSQHDNTPFTATNINSYFNGEAQIAIPSLDITTAGDSEWFYVNVPATTSGTMTVTVQSSNLSALAPKLQVYSSSLSLVGQVSAPNVLGATISVTAGVKAGQGYYIKVLAAGGPGAIGSYGLLVNSGSYPQSPIPPPNTVVPGQPDRGGGTTGDTLVSAGQNSAGGGFTPPESVPTTIGSLTAWAEALTITSNSQPAGGGVSFAAPNASNASGPAAQYGTPAPTLAIASPPVATAAVAPPAGGPSPAVLQALDEALGQLTSENNTTST